MYRFSLYWDLQKLYKLHLESFLANKNLLLTRTTFLEVLIKAYVLVLCLKVVGILYATAVCSCGSRRNSNLKGYVSEFLLSSA